MDLVEKVVDMFREYAKDIQHMNQEELGELCLFLYKIREDIESGRYDSDKKKWSDLEWRNQ